MTTEARETADAPGRNREGRRPSALLTAALALLTLSGLYLVGPARNAMDSAATAALCLHIGLGLLLVVPVGFALSRKAGDGRSANRLLLRIGFALAALTGIVLTAMAAQGQSTAHERGVWWMHCVAGGVAAVCWGIRWSNGRRVVRTPSAVSAALLALLCLTTLGLGTAVVLPRYDAANYYRDLTATNAEQAANPLFPAGVRLTPGSEREPAVSSASCGRVGCHETAHRQWLSSGHQLAASDPAYRKTLLAYTHHSGKEAAKWCEGCHAPLSLLPSDSHPFQPNTGPGTSGEGVGCVGCHAITDVSSRTGNGHFTLNVPPNYPFAEAQTGWKRRMHDFLVRVRPFPHQSAYLKPEIHASPEFCGTCHRQSFNVPQNGYQFVHGADAWGTWQAGPSSGRVARTAGLSERPVQTCRQCHFRRLGLGGEVSHASPGANSWLPLTAGDDGRAARIQEFLSRQRVTVDIFAWHRPGAAGQDEVWLAPLDAPLLGTGVRPGETGLLDIVVTNRSVGHEFPAGYLDIEEAWLEVTIRDGNGRLLAQSGLLSTDSASLPPTVHRYRMIPLERTGSALTHHELTQQVTTALRRTITPGGSDIARYRLKLPPAFTPPLRIQARLRYRPLRPDFARWSGSEVAVPVTTLAQAQTILPLSGSRISPSTEPATAQRFLEYGVGLLAPKEAPEAARARRAFLVAQQLAPNRPEAFLGLGRAYLAEPALLAARAQFDAALRLVPDSPAAQADLGLVYSKQGEYDKALHLLAPLALRFPQDGALQFDLGLTLFRSGNYAAAAEAFQGSLAADPDNAAAHFQLKQCYQHLHRIPEARREEAIGQYLAEDRLASLLVPAYLNTHPADRESARPIPEHLLVPLATHLK